MSIQQFYKNNKSNQPTHIYYNMNILNNDSAFPANPVRFQYKETRSNDFLQSPQDYFMSIVRFNLQTPTLPVFIPQINLNPDTNIGSIYPISAMVTSTADTYIVTLNGIYDVPIGAILLNVYSCPSLYKDIASPDTSGFQGQYSRVIASTVGSWNNTVCTKLSLFNSGGIVGTPANYPLNTPIVGFTQTLQYARFSIGKFGYLQSTNILSITINPPSFITVLGQVWRVGDTVYIQNSGIYNGAYIVTQVLGLELSVKASNLMDKGVPTVLNVNEGQTLSSIGDYYNVTPYIVTMTYTVPTLGGFNGGTYTYKVSVPITYKPDDLTTNLPIWNPALPQALTLETLTSSYYYIFSYQRWMSMVNLALNNCFYILQGNLTNGVSNFSSTVLVPANKYLPTTALSLTIPSPPTNASLINPPSMSWDIPSAKAILTADNYGFNTTERPGAQSSVIPYIPLYFNDPLSTLMDSFPYQFQGVIASDPLFAQLIFDFNSNAGAYIVQPFSPTGTPITTASYLAIQITQDHQTASLMNPIQSIVFTSTLLPVCMEQVGAPLILNGTSTNATVIGSTANIFPVITDFQVPFSALNTYVPDISYEPSGEYRLCDLYGTSPAKQIDIEVFWKDSYGLLHPFYIGSGCQASMKIMFRSKDYNNKELS